MFADVGELCAEACVTASCFCDDAVFADATGGDDGADVFCDHTLWDASQATPLVCKVRSEQVEFFVSVAFDECPIWFCKVIDSHFAVLAVVIDTCVLNIERFLNASAFLSSDKQFCHSITGLVWS